MLVLSRKVGERIVINDNISVKIVSIDQGTVRLGFEAPPEVLIHREEVRRRLQEQDYPISPPRNS